MTYKKNGPSGDGSSHEACRNASVHFWKERQHFNLKRHTKTVWNCVLIEYNVSEKKCQ